MATVAFAYFAAAVLGSKSAAVVHTVTTVWPGAGIALAAVLLRGRTGLVGVALGALAFDLSDGMALVPALIVTAGRVAEAALAGWLWRRLRIRSTLPRMRDALKLAFVCSTLAPIPAALIGPVVMMLDGSIPRESLAMAIATWWMGDGLGIPLVTPFVLAWRRLSLPRGRDLLIRIAPVALFTAVCWTVFSGWPLKLTDDPVPAAYFVLPVAIWIALTSGLRTVTLSLLLMVGFGVWSLWRSIGPFAGGETFDSHLMLHLFLVVTVITTLLVNVLARERQTNAERLHRTLDRLVAINSLSTDWYWEQDAAGRLTLVGGRAVTDAEIDTRVLLGKRRWEAPAEVSAEDRDRHDQAIEAHLPFRDVVLTRHTLAAHPVHVSISGEPMLASDGTFLGYRGVARDITLQRRAEGEIIRSQRWLNAVLDAIPSPVLVKDAQHRYIAANLAFQHFFQRPADQILGKNDHDFFGAKQAKYFIETDERALEGDLGVVYEEPYAINGHVNWMLVRKTGLTAPDGQRVVVLQMSDVTARHEAEEKLKASELRFRKLTELSADWYWEQDAQLRFTYLSPAAFGSLIGSPADILGRTREETGFEWESEVARHDYEALVAARKPYRNLVLHNRQTGHWGMSSGEPVFDADGTFTGYRGVGRDITSEKRAERSLRESEARFRDFAEAASEFVWEHDLEKRLTYLSPKVFNVLGYTDAELLGRCITELMPPGEADRVAEWLTEHRRPDGGFRELEHMMLTKSGATVWVTINAIPIRDEAGAIIGTRGTARDITDRKRAEERISQLATRDSLTGLPNRVLLHDRLEQGLVNARRNRESLALMFIDLDRFKTINDSLGHDVGDKLLQEVAARMQACLRKGDTLSRLGGDEFVVTAEGLQHAEDAAQVARKILLALAKPLDIAGHTLTTSASIGISIYPSDGEDIQTLMKNADTAMYYAKERGRRNYQFFSREMNIRAVERHELETALRLAIDRRELVLYYQPQVDMVTGQICGAETLLRWRHPKKGIVLPSTFMDVAEETGLIEPIGSWVLRAACAQAKAWQMSGYPPIRVAVNISARQFTQPKEFARSVHRILASTGLDPNWLELEMTESVLWKTVDESLQALRRLGKLGTRLAVDDFGTGYSSLAYLNQLPIDALKIDRSFIRDTGNDKDNDVIVATIIGMAHSLNLRVTAEGVESLGQLNTLKRLGCDAYQGFLFSRAMPGDEFAAQFLAPQHLNFGV